MTRQEFADKWGYQTGVGYGSAQFDCREQLLKQLDELIQTEVNKLALGDVSTCGAIPYDSLSDNFKASMKSIDEALKRKQPFVLTFHV